MGKIGSSACFLPALGMINCLGATLPEISQNLFSGNQSHLLFSGDFIPDKTIPIGKVNTELPSIPHELKQFDCRNNRLLLAAYRQIEDKVKACIKTYGAGRIGIVLATSTSGIAEGEQAIKQKNALGAFPTKFHYRQQEIGSMSVFLSQYTGIEGPSYTISTACSSSGKVFGSAQNLIRMGLCDAVIAGGSDALCKLTLNGFHALDAVSTKLCNPFSKNRDGINIGEGAALFLVTGEESGVRLMGVGESSDAHHISAPEPSGRGAIASMKAALAEAALDASDIGYINLHGTATPHNDAMESLAVYTLFGDDPLCSSTKALTGHTLGAAGATEAGFCWLVLQSAQHLLPPHIWDGEPDPNCKPLNFIPPDTTFENGECKFCLSNSFAFGGNNCSLILGKPDA